MMLSLLLLAAGETFSQAPGDYRSAVATGNWNSLASWERYNGSSWVTPTGGQGTPTNASGAITIQAGHTITVTANVSVDQVTVASTGKVTVNNVTLTIANGSGTDFTVNGTLELTGGAGAITTTGTLAFNSGGTYIHNRDGSGIPTATWNAASTCSVTGVISTLPTNTTFDQPFGNFTWNSTNQTADLSLAANLTTVNGNMTVSSTGSGSLRLSNSGASDVLTVGGNFSQTGGTFYIGGTLGSNTWTVDVAGDFSLTGGTLNMNGNSGSSTLNLAGDFTASAGVLTETGSGTNTINFDGTASQTYTSGSTISNAINFNVNNGATLQMATASTVVSGGGSFTVSNGGTLGVTSAVGITTTGATGNIQVTGTRTYSSGANYIYNGSANQVTGNGLTQNTPANLTIDNANTVTLSAATTITGNILISQGTLSTSASNFNITLDGTWTNNGSFTAGASTTTFSGTTQSIGGTNSTTFAALVIDNGSATTMNNSNTCSSLSFTAGGSASSLTHGGSSVLTVNGAVTLNQPTGNATKAWNINAGSATVSGAVTMAGTATQNNRISQIVLTTGTLNANGGISIAGTNTLTKVIIMSGGASTINLKGTLSGSANATLTAGTAGSIFNYADNASSQTINFFGAGAYHNLHVNTTGGTGATLAAAITTGNVTGNLRVQSGTLNNGGFAIAGNASRTLEVANSAFLKLGGTTSAFPTGFGTNSLGASSTVDYNGSGNQTISAQNYGNLTTSLNGTRTITLANSGTIGIAGTFSPAGGATSYTNTGSTVSFNGTGGSQNIPAFAFNNLTINNSSGVSLTGNVSVNGTTNALTFSNGSISTGANTITLASGVTVSGAGAGKYVNGNLAWTMPTGTPTRTFPIGDASNYTPVTIAYTTAITTGGTLTASTTAGDHPQVASSSLWQSRTVNRYWTLSSSGILPATPGYSATFNFVGPTPGSGDIDASTTPANFIIKRYSGGSWTNTTVGTRTATSTQATSINGYGEFQIGEDCATFTTANAGPDQTGTATCGLTSVTLNANTPAFGSGAWSVLSGSGGSFVDINNPGTTFNGVSGTAYVLRWTVTNGNCSAQDDVNITFLQLPTAGITNNSGTTVLTCSQTSISVTGTGGVSYNWDNGLGSGDTKSISSPGTYNVTVTGSNGCTASAGITITQDITAPTAGITNHTGSTELNCNTTAISVSATGGVSYAWDNGLGSGADKNISSPGTYTVTVTGSNGCTSQAQIQITQDINTPTAVITNVSGTSELTCTVTAIEVSASGGVSYNWNNGLGSGSNKLIMSPGTYTVTVTAANGCTDQESVTITQNTTAPTAGITNLSGSTNLTCILTGINVMATGGGTYSWDGGLGTNATANISAPGTYTVTVTAANGCTDQENINITQDITPPAVPGSISGPTDACIYIGTNTQVNYSISPVSGAVAYAWTMPVGIGIVSGQGTVSIQTLMNNQVSFTNNWIRVAAIGPNGCSSDNSVLEVRKNVPAIPAVINGPLNVCEYINQGNVTYSVDPVQYATSYTWTIGGTGMAMVSGQGTNSIDVTYDQTFTRGAIKVTANSNCGKRAPRSVNIYRTLPGRPGGITGETNICSYVGTNTVLTYSIAPVNFATSYTWVLPQGMNLVSGQGTTSINVTIDASFVTSYIRVNASNNCGAGGTRTLRVLRPKPSIPGIMTIAEVSACPNRVLSYTLPAMPGNTNTIQWTVPTGGTILSGQGTTSITVSYVSTAITGRVNATGLNDCNSGPTRSLIVRLPACPINGKETFSALPTDGKQEVIGDESEEWTCNIFPNPTRDVFNIQVNGKDREQIQVRVISFDGREIKRMTMMPEALRSMGGDIQPGTYFVEITQGEHRTVQKLIKL